MIFPFDWFGHYVFHLSSLPTRPDLQAHFALQLTDDWKNYARNQVAAHRARVVCRREVCVETADFTIRLKMPKNFENTGFLVHDYSSCALLDTEFLDLDRSSGFT